MEKQKISRNDYFAMISNTGKIPPNGRYEILDLDLSAYHLSEDTVRIANVNFVEETKDANGNYMLRGHWLRNLCQQFADKCKFDLVQVDGYSSYAYSDEQMAVFTYCEGDITLIPFTDKAEYEKEKAETIKLYKEVY